MGRRAAIVLTCLAGVAGVAAGCGGSDVEPQPALENPSAAGDGDGLLGGAAPPSEEKSRGSRRGSSQKKQPRSGSGGSTGGDPQPGASSGSSGGSGGSAPSAKKPKFDDRDIARGDQRAVALKRQLDAAKAVVRAVINALNTGDASVCSKHFTLHYMETITRKKGDEAAAQCRSTVSKSRNLGEMGPFGPSKIDGNRATVAFNLTIRGQLTSQRYQLVLGSDGRWRVDAAG